MPADDVGGEEKQKPTKKNTKKQLRTSLAHAANPIPRPLTLILTLTLTLTFTFTFTVASCKEKREAIGADPQGAAASPVGGARESG